MQYEGIVPSSTIFYLCNPHGDAPLPGGYSSVQETAEQTDFPILILARDRDIRYLYKTLLMMWGYRIEESDNLENSIAIINKKRPALILLDSVPPFEENLEIIRRLRKNRSSKNIPIIVVSGYSQPVYRSLSLAVGADNFFVKPVDFDSLQNYLQKNVGKQASTGGDL
jgi:two-component system phosphate regulon response regulator PhoB